MIMHRKPDGTYEEITAIKTKNGESIAKIRGRDGSVYFTGAVDKTVEGYPCILPKSMGKNAVDYSIYGNSTQDGTPSPDNPVEVQSVGIKTKNLFNIADFQTDIHLDINTGLPVKHNKRCGITKPIEVSGNSFVLTFEARNGLDARYMYSLFDAENKLLTRVTTGKSGDVVDFQNAKYVYIAFYDNSSTAVLTDDFSKIQFELGSTPTAYEPYGYKIPVITNGKNLFDVSQEMTTGYINASGSIVISADWETTASYIAVASTNYLALSNSGGLGNAAHIAFYDKNKSYISSSRQSNNNAQTAIIAVPNNAAYFKTCCRVANKDTYQIEYGSESTSYESYKEPVTTNIYLDEPLKAGEILISPENVLIHVDGTEETVILPKITTFKGTTVITTDTDVPPSDIKITYKSRR